MNPMNSLKIKKQDAILVLVDFQERLMPVMKAGEELEATVVKLVKGCKVLGVPILITEQYPKGLGHTLPELSALMPNVHPVEKTTFSCLAESRFTRQLTRDHSQVILSGMEAHICVVQTALDLQAQGKMVFVVEDAIVSRKPENKLNALNRLRQAGIIVTNTESVVFEWLKVAEGDAFKKISQLVR